MRYHYKHHFKNWQFDVSLFKNFGKFLENFSKNVSFLLKGQVVWGLIGGGGLNWGGGC